MRYLLVALYGGIYSDMDTVLHRPPSHWGRDAELWRGGKGWMEDDDIASLKAEWSSQSYSWNDEVIRLIGKPEVVVAIEYSVEMDQVWDHGYPSPVSASQHRHRL